MGDELIVPPPPPPPPPSVPTAAQLQAKLDALEARLASTPAGDPNERAELKAKIKLLEDAVEVLKKPAPVKPSFWQRIVELCSGVSR